MQREEDGVLAQVLLGAVPIAIIGTCFAPRVLDLVVFVAFLVLSDTDDKHTVVVTRIPIVLGCLVDFIGHLLLGDDFLPKVFVLGVFGHDADTLLA